MPEPATTAAYDCCCGCWTVGPLESVLLGPLRYLSGEDFGVVSKLVNERSGMLEERLMKEPGREP